MLAIVNGFLSTALVVLGCLFFGLTIFFVGVAVLVFAPMVVMVMMVMVISMAVAAALGAITV